MIDPLYIILLLIFFGAAVAGHSYYKGYFSKWHEWTLYINWFIIMSLILYYVLWYIDDTKEIY